MKKTMKQLAAEKIAEMKLKIFISELKGFGQYDGIGLEWEDYDLVGREMIAKTVCISDILTIDVEVCRCERGDREIRYLVDVKPYSDSLKVFSVSSTAEQAFAIKDLLDEMIEVMRAAIKPSETVSLMAEQLQAATRRLCKGEATLNQIREEFGLARIEDESMNQLYVWAAKA